MTRNIGSVPKPATSPGGLLCACNKVVPVRPTSEAARTEWSRDCVIDLPRMKAASTLLGLIFCATVLAGQTPATTPVTHTSDLGFAYSLPNDWEVVNANPTLPDVKEQAQKNASSDEEKKGVACVQVALTARHGNPASVLVVVELPFDCFGQSMGAKDLPGFAQGASEGIKQNFDVSEPVSSDYKLGSHSMWIERSKGSPKGHPEISYTVEITCTLLKKGAVCWMGMAADDDALKAIEAAPVVLEGESPVALVPATAFEKKQVP
jgi:hypothetical protein